MKNIALSLVNSKAFPAPSERHKGSRNIATPFYSCGLMTASGQWRYRNYLSRQNCLLYGIKLHGMEGVVLVSIWSEGCFGAGEHME